MIVYDTLNLSPSWQSGLTVTATVYPRSGGAAVTIAMPETPAGSARYVLQRADDEPLPAGRYDYTARNAAGVTVGTGAIEVDAEGQQLSLASRASQSSIDDLAAGVIGDAGGYAQTITVTNAATDEAIEGAMIRYTAASVLRGYNETNDEGAAVVTVSAGTFNRTVYAPGFNGVTAVGVVVTGTASATIELTPLASEGNPAHVAPGLAN